MILVLTYVTSIAFDTPFVSVVGDHAYLVSSWLSSFKAQQEGNTEVLTMDTKKDGFAAIMDIMMTYPMMGSRRLLVVYQSKEPVDKEQDKLIDYLSSPTPGLSVVWLIDKIDKRKKFYKKLLSASQTVTLETPKLSQMSSWVDRLAQKHGVKVDGQAKRLLIDFLGVDVGRIDQDIEKLALFAHPRTTLNKDDVMEMVLKVSGEDIFACTDAIMDQNAKKALETLHFLFASGVSPFAIVSMITRHVRILIKLQDPQAPRNQAKALAQYAGVPPFVLGKYRQQCQKMNVDTMMRVLGLMTQLDTDMKSTGIGATRLLEKAVIRMVA